MGPASKPAIWEGAQKLYLSGTSAAALRALLESHWPKDTLLNEFKYQRIEPLDAQCQPLHRASCTALMAEWLGRAGYSGPQPYIQLATLLKQEGDRYAADEIQYAGRVREKNEICNEGD